MTACARVGLHSVSTRMAWLTALWACRAAPVPCQGHVPAYRGRACEGDDTLLTGTGVAPSRPRPAPLVLFRRGLAKGEPTARRARAWGLSRQQRHTLRPRIQANLKATAPTAVRMGPAFAADEVDHNAGEKQHPTPRPR